MGPKLPVTNLNVGSTVTRREKLPSEHGVVTAINNDTVTVHWHLKQAEVRGRPGDSMGRQFELPTSLVLDTPCLYCKVS
jgi:hypothetical protein